MTAPGGGPHRPRPTPSPPGRPRWPGKLPLLGGIGLVLGLVVGLVVGLTRPAPPNRAPFEQALPALGQAPGVRYADTSVTGQKRDITTTRFGDQFGVTSYPGMPENDERVPRVGEKIYTKPMGSTDPRLGEWRGEDPNDRCVHGELIEEFPPPGELAARLATALAGQPGPPEPDDPDLPALTTTAGHPFWVPTQRAWPPARDLRPGQGLTGLPNGPPVQVTGNRAHQAPLTAHNPAVTGPHTHYLVANGTPVLVHSGTATRPSATGTPSTGWDQAVSAPTARTAPAAHHPGTAAAAAVVVRHPHPRAAPSGGADPPGATSCAKEKIDNSRSRHQAGKDKNIAIAEYEINGLRGERIGGSGTHQYPNSAPMPAAPRFDQGPADTARAADSEWKLLEELASQFLPGATGTTRITSEHRVCPSCQVVIDELEKAHPGTTVTAFDLGRGAK